MSNGLEATLSDLTEQLVDGIFRAIQKAPLRDLLSLVEPRTVRKALPAPARRVQALPASTRKQLLLPPAKTSDLQIALKGTHFFVTLPDGREFSGKRSRDLVRRCKQAGFTAVVAD